MGFCSSFVLPFFKNKLCPFAGNSSMEREEAGFHRRAGGGQRGHDRGVGGGR